MQEVALGRKKRARIHQREGDSKPEAAPGKLWVGTGPHRLNKGDITFYK
jgi:hypothetical protein